MNYNDKDAARKRLQEAKGDLKAGKIKFDPEYLKIKGECKAVLLQGR